MKGEKQMNQADGPRITILGNGKVAALLVALSFGCLAMLWFRPSVSGDVRFVFLLWNLFLAWLPYAASAAAVASYRLIGRGTGPRKLAIAGFGLLWLLFLPNAAYLTTDFIHLIVNKHNYVTRGEFSYLVWFDIVVFFLFAWCGLFLSFLSTYQMHRMVAERKGEGFGWAFVGVVSVLAGYGVFLGRIVRLNSWDAIFNPEYLMNEILGNLHMRALSFTLLFTVFLAVIYIFMYHLQERKR